jgi:hypothetical protein
VCGKVPELKCSSPDVFDDLDQLIEAVALAAGEGEELSRSLHDRATLRCSRDRDATSATELEKSLVSEQP